MKRLAAEMRDFRLPHTGTVHQYLSEIYKTHDHIMESIQAVSLKDKPSSVTKKEWERVRENKWSARCKPKIPKPIHASTYIQSCSIVLYQRNHRTATLFQNKDTYWRCRDRLGWEIPFREAQGEGRFERRGIRGMVPIRKPKFGLCGEGKLHLTQKSCWEASHPEVKNAIMKKAGLLQRKR